MSLTCGLGWRTLSYMTEMQVLRHESPVSTAIYTLVDVADVRDAVQRAARLA